jgi:hypothetical protein
MQPRLISMRSAFLAAVLLLAACAPRYGVSVFSDPFERTAVRRMHGNVLGGAPAGGDWVALDAEEMRVPADTPRYDLRVDYRTQGEWLDVRPGESLVVLIDGDPVRLAGEGSQRSRAESRVGRREVARYAVSAALLRRIAGARDVRVRLIGRRYHVDRVLTRANLSRLRRFLGMPSSRPSPASPPANPPRPSGT